MTLGLLIIATTNITIADVARLGNFVRSITIIIISLSLLSRPGGWCSCILSWWGERQWRKIQDGSPHFQLSSLGSSTEIFFLPTIAFGSIISNTLNSMMASSGTLMLKEASSDQVGLNPLFGTCRWSWWQWTVYWSMIIDDQWSLIITKIRVPLTALDCQDWASQGWPRTRIFTKGWIMSPACWWSYTYIITRVWSSTIYSTSEALSRGLPNLPADRESLEDVGPRWVGCWAVSPGIDISYIYIQ